MASVLVGERITNNIQELTQDPVVIQMYQEFKKAGYSVKEEYNSWQFISMTTKVYHSRGGKNSQTIGAVAAALLELEGATL
jgi:phage terminase large subunit-like protein